MIGIQYSSVPWFLFFLLAGTLLILELGYLFGLRQKRLHPELAENRSGAIEASVFALLGLLLAFTFSSAQSRLEERRRLIIEEANNIGTAYLRLDLLPAEAQPALRQLFRKYLESRIAVYRAIPDLTKVYQELDRSSALQGEIWKGAVAAIKEAPPNAAILVLPAFNQMIDITTTRTTMAQTHTPETIFALLLVVALFCAGMAGYGMSKTPGRNWFHRLAFTAIVGATVFVILDLEFPRRGIIRLEASDQLLVNLRQSWGD